MKAHHVAFGALAALVVRDLVVKEEEQLLFAGIRWAAQKLNQPTQQPPAAPPLTYYGWPYYSQRRVQRYPYGLGQYDPENF